MKRLSASLLFGCIGFILGALTYATSTALMTSTRGTVDTSLTNPAVDVTETHSLTIGERRALQEELRRSAEEAIRTGVITNYGIYYRELISGPAIALNQEQGFFPASLLKIPVAMWYYKQAETDPDILTQEINFTGPAGVTVEYFMPQETIHERNRYTIEELIEYMLIYSDNNATQILTEYAGGRDRINEVYIDVGIRDIEDYNTYSIDTQTYVAFFRVLYNTEYLNETYSKRILSILSRSAFTAGLTASLPEQVRVAHKFGERAIDTAKGVGQLHDCGIVYAPGNPYLVCVMTQGHAYDAMARFISSVSASIYEATAKETS